MPSDCTVCELDLKPRKVLEGLLKVDVDVRTTGDFSEFMSLKHGWTKVSKSALDRHRRNGHMPEAEAKPRVSLEGEPVLDLDDFVDEMWIAWQAANRGKVPDSAQLMKWIELRAKVRGDMERRKEESMLRTVLEGAAPEE